MANKRAIVLAATAGVCLVATIMSLVMAFPSVSQPQDLPLNDVNEQDMQPVYEDEQEEYLYVVRDFNGKVAVFKIGNDVPEYVFNVYTNALPALDQQQLGEGIYAKNDYELRGLIEDYSS